MEIINIFQTTSKSGSKPFRLKLTDELFKWILDNREQGRTNQAIDIMTTKNGMPIIKYGKTSDKRAYTALMYYKWAVEPQKKEEVSNVQQGT